MAKKKSKEDEGILDLRVTPVFTKNLDAYNQGFRNVVNIGGARSSKTYSILQVLIYLAQQSKVDINIIRQTMPALKESAMKDFFDILESANIYDERYHNQTSSSYEFSKTGSVVKFIATDDGQKLRGSKRDLLYCCEANELTQDVFEQLNMRTTKCIFMDFNPSDGEHFIYDLMAKETSTVIKSTYKDNSFLPQYFNDIIEGYRIDNPEYYKVFALGERSNVQTKVYTHFQKYVDEPKYSSYSFGLDFGYNNETAITKIMYVGKNIYVKEILYKSKLTSSDLIKELDKLFSDEDRKKPIYSDYARPDLIEDLRRVGYNPKVANKAVTDGIDYVKSSNIYVHVDSLNLWTEYKLYSWKSKGNIVYDEVVKSNDHLLDSMRYAIFTEKKRGSGKANFEIIFI